MLMAPTYEVNDFRMAFLVLISINSNPEANGEGYYSRNSESSYIAATLLDDV